MVNHRQPYREKVSRLISWGHWFALFNILLAVILGSRYLLVTDWPATFSGRIYAYVSLAGHFSFLVFICYLLILFPLTFIVPSQRILRFIATILATAGMTLLLIDSEIFTRFHIHVNMVIWELITSTEKSELTRGWQAVFIAVPVILLTEMVFASWSWQKIRSLTRRRHYVRPFVLLLFLAFIATHIIYIWADANFYRPVTMQRANLPLSYPMTARGFLAKHGLLDAKAYQQRQFEQGSADALSIQYPLSKLSYQDHGTGYNLLLLTVNQLNYAHFRQQMPFLASFADNNNSFNQHFSSGIQPADGAFSLFYGISPFYIDGVLAARTPSALISALNHQGYQFGLFSSEGFTSPLYRQSLISDFSLPAAQPQTDSATVNQWLEWFTDYASDNNPWFSWLALNGPDDTQHYPTGARQTDKQIQRVLQTLKDSGRLSKTVVVITAKTGQPLTKQQNAFPWRREQLQVPLIIHWPNTPAQQINRITDHQDVMATLMQHLLHVSTRSSEFSQGEDLFTARPRQQWAISASSHTLAITTGQMTLVLNNYGNYEIYDHNGEKQENQKPPVDLLLRVLTEERRFIAW